MTAQTGRTNARWLGVFLDNSSGTLTDLSSYISEVSQFGLTYDTTDVTAFADAVKNITIGKPGAPITLTGPLDTTLITHVSAINGVSTPLTLDLRMGIRHAWEAGEPQFGITSSSTVGYLVTSFMVDWNNNKWTATLDVMGATAPAFGTAAET